MQRIAIRIEYDGTGFRGWQLQPGVRTVQGVLEDAVARAAGASRRIVLHGAGRTDTGVHARAQVAHFDTDAAHTGETFARAINFWAPDDAAVVAAARAHPEFHARFSVVRKTYRYTLVVGESPRPLCERYAVRLIRRPDVDAMEACARTLLGCHDFAAFTSSGGDSPGTVKTIFRSTWHEDGPRLHYEVEGDGFTYNMVRTLVGSMLEAGAGRISRDRFVAILRGRDRRMAGPTAPARGLALMDIRYPDHLDPFQAKPKTARSSSHSATAS